jgi:hypothetical protein
MLTPVDRAWSQHSKPKHDESLSNFALNSNVRRYAAGGLSDSASQAPEGTPSCRSEQDPAAKASEEFIARLVHLMSLMHALVGQCRLTSILTPN